MENTLIIIEKIITTYLILLVSYHLGLFITNKKDPVALFFSIYCLLFVLRINMKSVSFFATYLFSLSGIIAYLFFFYFLLQLNIKTILGFIIAVILLCIPALFQTWSVDFINVFPPGLFIIAGVYILIKLISRIKSDGNTILFFCTGNIILLSGLFSS